MDDSVPAWGNSTQEDAGEVTGGRELADEGRADQAKAAVKEGVEKVEDAVGGVVDSVAKHLGK
ncbi:CsbD family protein [Lentzea sp. DG1S-22]|uniref:CsbD family protein n=1 Tax=Lentzea sp. DG1S-22 TaxID=3108822 RepID=UPI002E783417|nr:CsbD family protein [Lentzea sp. DG1S-22]WVH77317.1 CsbD family protein [Lentzea sp. DG1S-22]